MKHLVFCTLMLVSIISYAQNGGQAPENNSVKIEYAGFQQVRIHNKQSCEGVIRVGYNNVLQNVTVPGNSSVLFNTPVPGKFTAKATTNCGSADFGLVELNITAALLPVKFKSLKAIPLDDNKIQVDFEIAEATNVKYFNVQTSLDSKTWTTVTVVFPNEVEPNRLYSVKINLSRK